MCKSQIFWICSDDCCSDFVYAHNRDAQTLIQFSNSCLKCPKFFFGFCQFHEKGENLRQETHGNNPLLTKGNWGCSLPLFYGELHERCLLMLPETSSLLESEQIKGEKCQGKRQSPVQWTTACGASAWSWSWGGEADPWEPEKCFRLTPGSKWYFQASPWKKIVHRSN